MEIYSRLLADPCDSDEYHSMTTEWDTYFASQKYRSKDNAWRDAVLDVLEEMNILEVEHKSDPKRAVRAMVDEVGRRVPRRRSTD
jgi:hypothetical protein